jgi:hypothetical protein
LQNEFLQRALKYFRHFCRKYFLIEREGRALPPFTLPPAALFLQDVLLFYFQRLFLQQTLERFS